MTEDIVIAIGRVTSITANTQYNSEPGITLPVVDDPITVITFGPEFFNAHLSFTGMNSYDGTQTLTQMSCKGAYPYGEEYEIVLRKVKKHLPSIIKDGAREFIEDEGVPF